MNCIGIIPARGGSKGVPGKNIKSLGGHPLIAHSIVASLKAPGISRTIVSTDSEEIAEIARAYGAEVPFIRPSEFAQDRSSDLEFMLHFFAWHSEKHGTLPDLVAHIRPTTPLRDPAVVAKAIVAMTENPEATGLRSVHRLSEPVEKLFRISDTGLLEGIFPDHPEPEYYNLPRQRFRPCFYPNGYIDVVRPAFVKSSGRLHGPKIIGFETEVTLEVDTPDDFSALEYQITKKPYWTKSELESARK